MSIYDHELDSGPLQAPEVDASPEYSGDNQQEPTDSVPDQIRLEEIQRNTDRQLLTVAGGLALMGLGIYSEKKGIRIGEVPFYGGFGINVMAGIHMWLNSLRKNKIEYSGR